MRWGACDQVSAKKKSKSDVEEMLEMLKKSERGNVGGNVGKNKEKKLGLRTWQSIQDVAEEESSTQQKNKESENIDIVKEYWYEQRYTRKNSFSRMNEQNIFKQY